MIKLTLYTPLAGGLHVGKEFSLDDSGALVATPARPPIYCRADVLTFPHGLAEIFEWLQEVENEAFAVGHHVPKAGGDGPFFLVTGNDLKDHGHLVHMYDRHPEIEGWRLLARTAGSIKRAVGDDGRCLLVIDYDPIGAPLDQPAVLATLAQIEPQFADAACVHFGSSSSHLTVDGEMRKGAGGARFIFEADCTYPEPRQTPQDDPADLQRIFGILVKRLVLAGHFVAKVRKSGVLHLGTIIDPAMGTLTQPDFWGAPGFNSPRIGRARPPIAYREGGVLSLRDIAPLSADELAAYRAIASEQEHIHADEMAANKAASFEAQVGRSKVTLAKTGRPVDELEIRERLKKAQRDRRLSWTDVIFVDSMDQWVPCNVIAANPHQFEGLACSSPSNPFHNCEPGDERPARGKGTIRINRGDVGVYDHVTGHHVFFQIDAMDFEGIISANRREDRKDLIGTPDPTYVEDGPQIDPAPVVESVLAFPLVATEDVASSADSLVNRTGATTIIGYDLEREVLRAFVEGGHRGQIIVPAIADAVALKRHLAEIDPSLKVMIVPGRAADANAIRKAHGEDTLEFFDDFGGRHGSEDILCYKREAVIELHEAGFVAVSGQVCIRSTETSTVKCQFIQTCGFLQRERAVGHADIHIRLARSILGEVSPMAVGSDAPMQPSDTLWLSAGAAALCERHEWPIRVFEASEVLSEFLGCVRQAGGGSPSRAPTGFWDRLEEYVGQTGVTPSVSPQESLERATRYRRVKTKRGTVPAPAAIARAIEAYFNKEAAITEIGNALHVRISPALRRPAESRVMLASTDGASAPRVANLLKKTKAAEPIEGGRSITRCSERRLPSRVVQILQRVGKKAGQRSVAEWCAHDKDLPVVSAVRDVWLDVAVRLKEKGPGLLVVENTPQVMGLFGGMAGLTILPHAAVAVASVCKGGLPKDARWAMVIGVPFIRDSHLRDAVVDLPVSQWSDAITDPTKPIARRVRPEFFTRDQGSVRPGYVEYRRAGTDQAADVTLFGLTTASVIRVAEWLAAMEAEDGVDRELAVVANFPLAHPAALALGVLVDEVVTFESAFPPAATELRRAGMSVPQIAQELGMSQAAVKKALQRAK